jgi:proteasome alpha subunit
MDVAIRTWAIGDRAQRSVQEGREDHGDAQKDPDRPVTDTATLDAHLHRCIADKKIECALLDRHAQVPSKYRVLNTDELRTMLPQDLRSSLT